MYKSLIGQILHAVSNLVADIREPLADLNNLECKELCA